jgi:hypothetical protein
MALPEITYPALYVAAGEASNSSQRFYLWLIRSEYFLLMIAAILALDLSKEPIYFTCYAGVFFASLIVLLCRSLLKPEQNWYKSRALAESIKTSTWRYVMRAGPFDDAESVKIPRGNFRNTLKNILDANKHIGERMAGSSSVEHQISPEMETIRATSLSDRIAYYDEHRVREQRALYTLKAGTNKRAFNVWLGMSILTYVVASGLTLARISYPNWSLWPIDFFIVAASATIGWIQVKKFSELAASYTLTAHEIGIIQGRITEIEGEIHFSEFVNEAELAFSREHTQWVARQQQ